MFSTNKGRDFVKIIFIVDDNNTNLMAAKIALDGKYKVYALPSADRMFKLAEHIQPDLILMDVDMPEVNGFDAMEAMKENLKLKDVPVVFLTARIDEESEIRGFEMGALDFINKPFSAPVLIRRIETHIETDRIIKDSLRSVHKMHYATINVIAELVESRDEVTGGHIVRTQKYVETLINKLISIPKYSDIISKWDLSIVLPSSQLHDVGKIVISDTILNKPGKLTDDEFEIIKTHCLNGKEIVDRISEQTNENSFLSHARNFAYTHHERWDGTGYPQGLKGEDIPLEGRILAIADVYDALVSERPYKEPFTHDQAVDIIRKSSGSHFDPVIVEVFLDVADDFLAVFM